MKEQRKVLNIGLSIIGGLSLIGLIIGTFLDKKITGAMGNMDSAFGILFTMLAPVLSLAVASMGGAILFFMPKIENKVWDIVLRVLGVVAFFAFSAFSIKEAIDYVDFPVMQAEETTYKVLAIVLVVLIDLGIVLFTKISIKKMDAKRIIPTIITIFIIIAAWLFVSEVIKHLASRPRPRNIDDPTLEVAFRNWYEFRPFQCLKKPYKDCKSFVSGHTFISACLIGSIPLMLSLSKSKSGTKATIIGLAIGGVFTFVVAFSRIVAKAHFMSDVMGGIFFSVLAQLLIFNVAPKIYEKIKK